MRASLFLLLLSSFMSAAANYTAERTTEGGVEVIRLSDRMRGVEVMVAPSVGNRAYAIKVHGKNLLYFPLPDAAALKNSNPPAFNAIPFLAPWANRMAGASFWANGKKYLFNPDLGTLRLDPKGIAIHGMLSASPLWEVTSAGADRKSAYVTSRLQFWKYPDLMANWPFAHEYEMTYRLADGAVQVSTTVRNLSAQPMPMALGYHPYFNIPDVPREQQTVHIGARKHVETDPQLVATGDLTASQLPDQVSLKDHTFDDGYTDLIRNNDGKAIFSVQGGGKKIEVVYGPKYQVAVVYAPPGKEFVCFEPMTAITNGVNLNHDGKYSELQMVAPGGVWSESFWIRWTGL